MRDRRVVPYRVGLKAASRKLRTESTPAERKLWFEFLRYLPEKFTRQKPLGSYIADFYCSRLRLIVEVDGDSHYTTRGAISDAGRTKALAALQLRVIRFTNFEVMQQFPAVCEQIERILIEQNKNQPPAPPA